MIAFFRKCRVFARQNHSLLQFLHQKGLATCGHRVEAFRVVTTGDNWYNLKKPYRKRIASIIKAAAAVAN